MPARKISDAELTEALLQVFREYGYEGATLSRLCAATGLERASLYHRFAGGKQQMALAVLDHVGDVFRTQVLAPVATPGPARDRAAAVAERLSGFYGGGQRNCVLDTLSLADGGAEVAAKVAELYRAWQDAYAALARSAGFAPEEASVRAGKAIEAIHGALVRARATGDRAPFAAAAARTVDLLTGA